MIGFVFLKRNLGGDFQDDYNNETLEREKTDWRPLPLNSWQWKLNIQTIFDRISGTYYSVRYDRLKKRVEDKVIM